MFKHALVGALVTVGFAAGSPGVAQAECWTLAECAVETAQTRVAETLKTLEDTVDDAKVLVAAVRADLEARVQAVLTDPTVVRAGQMVEDAPGGKTVTCVLQGRWTESTSVATGAARCVRRSYLNPDDPRNGDTSGSFAMTLVKRYALGETSGCAFSLRSPDYGMPEAYGKIMTGGWTYNVLLEGLYGGALGNHAGRAGWWDVEHQRHTSQAAYVLNAEPVSVLQAKVNQDCSGDLFVNAVVTLFVI